jgi:hypothetical protein
MLQSLGRSESDVAGVVAVDSYSGAQSAGKESLSLTCSLQWLSFINTQLYNE